jgi:hypothetical protein
MGAAVAAMVAKREREVVEDFRNAGATSPEKAQPYTATGYGASLAMRRLHRQAVIREAAPGRYYLDEEVWAAVRKTRMRIVMVLVLILGIVLVGMLFGGIK